MYSNYDIMNYDMRKVINLFIACIFIFVPNIVSAECDYNERNELQALASNLNFSYNYSETNEGINSKVNFSITITNMVPELYIVDQTNIKVYYYNPNKEVTIDNYQPGSTTQFIIYGNSGGCNGTEIINNYVTLPSYNRFYKDEVCNGVNNYKLCNRWSRVDLSYDDFVKKVNDYREQIKQEIPPIIKEKSILELIFDFIAKYSFYVFGLIIVICSGLIVHLKRKDDFDLG